MQLIYHDRRAYISRGDLAKIYNVEEKGMNYYESPTKFSIPLERVDKNKLPKEEGVRKNAVYFDLLKAISWYRKNIDTTKAVKKEKGHIDDPHIEEDEEYKDGDKITIANMKFAKEFESALKEKELRVKEELANSVRRGELISIDDYDRSSANLLTNMLVSMTNIMDELPSEVATSISGIDKELVKRVISTNFKHTMDDLKEKLSKYE